MSFASTSTEFALLDSRTASGAFILPASSAIPGRILNIKDPYGAFTRSTVTVYTAGGDTFEDGTTFKVLNNAFDTLQVYAGSTTMWYITGGTFQNVDTANISVISTIQTYNWASLCNNPNTGYASTFNPGAIGRISFLDNVFTSSVASLQSSFIELGNLNAAPSGMNPGGTFRWLAGVEPDLAPARGLQFKLKQWQSFSASPTGFYGANTTTLRDLTVWDNFQNLTHNGTFMLSTIGTSGVASPGALRFTNASGVSYIQFGSTMIGSAQNVFAGGDLVFGGINAFGNEAMRIKTGVAGDAYPGVRIGINCNAPSHMLDINGGNLNIQSGNLYLSTPAAGMVLQYNAGAGYLRTQCNAPIYFGTLGSNFHILTGSQMGLSTITPLAGTTLDVNGLSRGKLIISNVTGTSLTVTANSYGVYHNLTNTGFNSLTLTALSGSTSNNGWYVLLRNGTPVSMSVTVTGTACNNIPSPLAIGSSNSVTLAWDTSLFRVF